MRGGKMFASIFRSFSITLIFLVLAGAPVSSQNVDTTFGPVLEITGRHYHDGDRMADIPVYRPSGRSPYAFGSHGEIR
jgi:hypothetical protein